MINENFVFLGALLSLIGSLNYVWNTLRGKTKPNRVTWFLWALAPMIAFTAMINQGVSFQGALMTFMVGFGPLMIFIASFVNKKSVWKITKFDMICGALSILGIIAWLLTQTGNVAIFFSIVADGLAVLPTLVKSFNEPETESSLVFLNAAISAVITLLTVTIWDFQHIAFPIYIFIVCFLLFILIQFRLGPKIKKLKV